MKNTSNTKLEKLYKGNLIEKETYIDKYRIDVKIYELYCILKISIPLEEIKKLFWKKAKVFIFADINVTVTLYKIFDKHIGKELKVYAIIPYKDILKAAYSNHLKNIDFDIESESYIGKISLTPEFYLDEKIIDSSKLIDPSKIDDLYLLGNSELDYRQPGSLIFYSNPNKPLSGGSIP